MDWMDLLAVQGTLESLLQHHTSKASILRGHLFEGNPVDEGTKRRVTGTPVHHSVKAAVLFFLFLKMPESKNTRPCTEALVMLHS